jgi:hypothetical protein
VIGDIIEVTFVLIMAYLILTNADGFSKAATAVSGLYNGAVRTLQGR